MAVLNRMWPIFLFGGDRELVFLARSRVTGRRDSEPSCAGVVVVEEGGVDAFPLAFLVCLFRFLLPVSHFHFIPPTLSLLPSPSWASMVELSDGATHLLLDMLES